MMTPFYPAKRKRWVTWPYFPYNALDLACRCRLDLDEESLQRLRSIPKNAGIIVVSNHSDEMDIRVLIEAARRGKKKFRFMVNQEAFEEMRGFAGFWLSRIGCFSVERGTSDAQAREFALATVKGMREALVMFPEGEIFYLNDEVQRFKTGAVFLGFEALQSMRSASPQAEVYVVPVGLKYRYEESVTQALRRRLQEMENKLQIRPRTAQIQDRLNTLIKHTIDRYRMQGAAKKFAMHWTKWGDDIRAWRTTALNQLEIKYKHIWEKPSQQLMDRSHRLISKIRQQMNTEPKPQGEALRELRRDLDMLKRTVWFAGWAPQYHMEKPSEERLAESVIKLERELLGVQRPEALGGRRVSVRVGEPVPLARFLPDFKSDSKAACRKISDYLHDTVQRLVERKPALPVLEILPGKSQMKISNRCVTSEDGEKVFFDHYRAGHKKAVIIAPGFFNSKSALLLKDLALTLSDQYDAVAMDFRGHGQSSGLFYWTTKEHLDLKAVIAYLQPKYQAIGVIGFSLGAATSIITAAASPDIQTVIAVSPPTEFEKIEYRFWELEIQHDIFYNLVGEGRYGKGVRPGPFWMKKDKPIECVSKVQAPILFIHGTRDWLIKPEHSVQLYEAARSHKKIEMIEGGPHAEYLILKNREKTLTCIADWLEETL